MDERPRILIADDHALVCEGLRGLLEPAYAVVGMVSDGDAVMEAVRERRPDLALLDISLPGRNGLDLARALQAEHPEVKTLVLTMHAERLYADEALRAGAGGFVLKLASGSELRFAVSEVLAGRTYVTPLLAVAAGADTADPETPRGVDGRPLTTRQQEVLRYIARGYTTAQIAGELGITDKAVEFHRTRLRQVLGLSSNAALVRWAVAHGMV